MSKFCPKCNSIHTKPGQFCSRTCANSRGPRSDEFKATVSRKLAMPKETRNYHCSYCGESLNRVTHKHVSDKSTNFCSRKCAGSYPSTKGRKLSLMHRDTISRTRKQLFANGRLEITGGHTKWISYNGITVQGTYEHRTCYILDQMQARGEIASWEYTTDRYPYVKIDNQVANYLLDFKVYTNDQDFFYLETKGYIRENDSRKWEAVRKLGYILIVWFEEDITAHEQRLMPE